MHKLYHETEDYTIFPVQIDEQTHLLNAEGTVLQPEILKAVLNGVCVDTDRQGENIVLDI